jgi:hypothetical protein
MADSGVVPVADTGSAGADQPARAALPEGRERMNKVARKGLVTAMVAGGVLGCAGYAQADAAAEGGTAGSPGVLSGNSVQVPVDVPVTVCGNTLDVVGLLNPASGVFCATPSTASPAHAAAPSAGSAHSAAPGRGGRHAGAPADEQGAPMGVVNGGPRRPSGAHAAPSADTGGAGGARAAGDTQGSSGLLSGNSVRLPIDLPVNITGNSVNVVGVGNPSTGNTAVNGEAPRPPAPAAVPEPEPVHNVPVAQTAPVEHAVAPTLAHTGADGLGGIAAASAGLLLGGAVLYRRSRAGRTSRAAALAGAGAGAGAAA